MDTIRKMLVPTDFSESADKAIEHALGLANELHASLTLLHVFQAPMYLQPPYIDVPIVPDVMGDLQKDCQERLRQAKERFATKGGPPMAMLTVEGTPADQIVRTAQKGQFDLIVIGTHGRTGLSHLLRGSVAEQVVRRAKCPVLTIGPSGEATRVPPADDHPPREGR